MSKTLRTIATIAAGVALVATGVGAVAGGAVIGTTAAGTAVTLGAVATSVATYAGLAAGVASVAAQITAPKPVARGSTTRVVIDAEPPRPYMIGESYSAGILRHRVGYGPTLKKVPNPYLWEVKVFSGVGPVEALVEEQFDFSAVGGYYSGFYSSVSQLGQRPESGALTPPFGAAPGWSSSHKLSGCAAIGGNYKFDKDGKVFASGAPLHGAIWRGEKVYDPRLDSTYPGGSGSCRLGDESTYVYSASPALHAGTYAYGRYQNGIRIFGLGLSREAIDWAAIVDWANDCDTVEWTIHGTIYEGGRGADVREQRVRNLDDICAAGGGRWLQAGALLSFDWHRPRVPLATLTDDDLLEEGGSATAVQTIRDRMNGIRPQYISPAHNWEQITADEIIGSTYRTEDGQPLTQTWPLNLVKDAGQAGELASYALVDSREIGPIEVKAKAAWRFYKPGETITVNSSLLGYEGQAVIIARDLDPQTLAVKLVLKTETPAKHDFALGKVANPPPSPILTQTQEDRDLAKYGAITPRQRDVEYDDGQTGEDLQPAEPGATEGAVIPTPGSGGTGNVKDETGAIRDPGEILNSELLLTQGGRLTYERQDGPVLVGQITPRALEVATVSALKQAELDTEALQKAVTLALSQTDNIQTTLRDAGVYVDPANGQVKISALDKTTERLNLAEITLDAQRAAINLKASTNYVDEQIILAAFDPSQVADLTAIFTRLGAAEVDIDGLNAALLLSASATELSLVEGRVTNAEIDIDALQGEIVTKVSNTTFDALDTRVTNAETTLTAIGDVSTIVNAVSATRLVQRQLDDNTDADIRALLLGDKGKREEVAAIAAARNELGARITEQGEAQAEFNLTVQARFGDNEAAFAQQVITTAGQFGALTESFEEVSAALEQEIEEREGAVETLDARVTEVETASVTRDGEITAGLSRQVTAQRGSEKALDEFLDRVLSGLMLSDRAYRESSSQVAFAREEITAQLNDAVSGIVASVFALGLRVGASEGSIRELDRIVFDEDTGLVQSLETLTLNTTVSIGAVNDRVDTVEGDVSNTIGRVDTLEEDLPAGLAAEEAARNVAISGAITAERVLWQEGDSIIAGDLATLTTTVGENTATLVTYGESIDGLEARGGIRFDINGRISGVGVTATADTTKMTPVVDAFELVDPDTGFAYLTADEDGLRLQNGKIVLDTGTNMKVQGLGFGTSNQFVSWYGPTRALNLCDEASAYSYEKVDGSAYFGGSLSAGVIRNSARTTDITNAATITIGPFGTNGEPILVVTSYGLISGQTIAYPATTAGLDDWEEAVTLWGATATGTNPNRAVNATKAISCSIIVETDGPLGASSSPFSTLTISGGTETLVGTAPIVGDSDGVLVYTRTISGSVTATDNSGGTANRTFIATLTTRTDAVLGTIQSQTISLTATEE